MRIVLFSIFTFSLCLQSLFAIRVEGRDPFNTAGTLGTLNPHAGAPALVNPAVPTGPTSPIRPTATADSRIDFVKKQFQSGNPEAFRNARFLIDSGLATEDNFDGVPPGMIPNLLRANALQLVQIARDKTKSQEEQEAAKSAAALAIENFKSRMGEADLNHEAFIRASNNIAEQVMKNKLPGNPEEMKELGKLFGTMLTRRFNLGDLPNGADKGISDNLRLLWQRGTALAEGKDTPKNAFEVALLNSFREGINNQKQFWAAMDQAPRNLAVLGRWTENMASYVEDLKRTEQSNFLNSQPTEKQRSDFVMARTKFLAITGAPNLSSIDTAQFVSRIKKAAGQS